MKPPPTIAEQLAPIRIGTRLCALCMPGDMLGDWSGTVTAKVQDRWGHHLVVEMDDGTTEHCHGIATVGSGWYILPPEQDEKHDATLEVIYHHNFVEAMR